MRFKTLIAVLACLGIATLAFSMSGRSQKPEEQPEFEIIEIGTGGAPKWSPDGTKLAFISSGWLCVANADGSAEIERIAELRPWTFDWMSDSAFVVSEKIAWSPPGKGRGHKFIIETVDMHGQVEVIAQDSIPAEPELYDGSYLGAPFVLKDGTVGYYEVHETLSGQKRVLETIRPGSLSPEDAGNQTEAYVEPYPWGDIRMRTIDDRMNWAITEDHARYSFPQLSPDGSRVLAVLESYTSDLVVLDTSGLVLARLDVGFKEVSPGVFAGGASSKAQWSPDGKRIAFTWFVESEQHPEQETSDLCVINADGTGKVRITDTPEEAEQEPAWSPDGTKIACHSQNTEKVFVISID